MPVSRKSPKVRRPLFSIAVTTAPEAAEAIAELLYRETAESAVITHSRVTGLSTTTAFVDAKPARPFRGRLRRGIHAIADCGLEVRPARIVIGRVPATDWRESWKRHFSPLSIRDRLLVRASWHRVRAVRGQSVVVLDPGLSFGTGQHPTTEFCLREIVRLGPARGESRGFLDVGTGSGILAIAAAKLGYQPASGFDFDPEAVRVARRNAVRNRVGQKLTLSLGDVAKLPLNPRKFHAVVCANLTADLLQLHAARLVTQLQPAGHLVLAGILDTEFEAVRRCFAKLGLELIRSARRKEWRSGSFRPAVEPSRLTPQPRPRSKPRSNGRRDRR